MIRNLRTLPTLLLVLGGPAMCAPTLLVAAPPAGTARAEATVPGEEDQVTTMDVLEGIRSRQIAATGEGTGDGRMTLSLTNLTPRRLRVVLPPGLIASGASGQFGGMGGMGGGMGGMGGGMGGRGGGMGGMGGGMGGMGGGMGGMGGGMMGGGTMPASMGMMMLGRLIMNLVGDKDSWDMTSLMSGMMGGMGGMGIGGMGMGGMGMGMGGMGGGGRGGGGFRSVAPTGLPFATLESKQTRRLPTKLVGLSRPDPDKPILMPARGERLAIGEIGQATRDERVKRAMARLARDKAPQAVAQVAMWRLAGGQRWNAISEMSRPVANAHELTLARDFVERLDRLPADESGELRLEIDDSGTGGGLLARRLAEALEGATLLGLKATIGVPAKPEGPAVACKLRIDGDSATAQVAISDGAARAWAAAGKFTLPVPKGKEGPDAGAFVDAMAEGILDRLIRVQLAAGPRVKGKPTHRIKIDNASPLVLNGLAIVGKLGDPKELPKVVSGLSISPFRSMTLPASDEVVKELGLKKGIRAIAADLSGL